MNGMIRALFAFILLTTIVRASDFVPVTTLTFTPDGRQIVFNTAGGLVVRDLDDQATPKPLLELDWPKITDAAFDSSGRWLAVTGGVPGEKGGVILMEWQTRRVIARWEDATDLITAAAWTHVGDKLAVASHDLSVRVFVVGDGALKQPLTLSGHTRPVFATAFSPDDKLLVSAGADRTLKVWDAQSGKLERTLAHHTDTVHCVAFRPKHAGNYCASGGADQTVRVWQPVIGRMVRIVRNHDAAIFAVVWSLQGDRLFSAGQEGIIRVIDADSDRILHSWKASDDWIYRLAINPDGTRIASGGWHGEVKISNLAESPAAKP
jgi:WD40 repeat protein